MKRSIDDPTERVRGVIYRLYCTHPQAKDMTFVGVTTLGKKTRSHWISQYKSKQTKIGWAIRTFGAKNFKYEILAEAKTRFRLAYLAVEKIEEYNSVWPNGLNISYGGNQILPIDWLLFIWRLKGKNVEKYIEEHNMKDPTYLTK